MRTTFLAQLLCGAVGLTSVQAGVIEKRDGPTIDLTPFHTHTFPRLTPEQAKDPDAINKIHEAEIAKKTWIQPHEKGSAKVAQAIHESFAVGEPKANVESFAAATTCTTPAVHFEWRALTDAHKQQYIAANKCLFGKPSRSGLANAKNRWDDLVAVHQHLSSVIHGVGQFLPWHRYYLKVFETLLRNECGYTGPMTWWDETKDAGNFHNAVLFTNTAYFGHAVLKTASGQGTCITSGAFANTVLDIGPGQGNGAHCLSRAVDESLSAAITQSFVNQCNSYSNYTDMWKCNFYGPHAYGHDAMGAVMSDVDSSPGDPIFFMHHAFVDHMWRIWQNMDSSRLTQMNGYTTQSEPAGGWVETTLDYTLTSLGLIPDVTIRDVMNTVGPYLCYKYDY